MTHTVAAPPDKFTGWARWPGPQTPMEEAQSMSARPTRRTFQLTLTDAGTQDSSPVIHRLRSLLKVILRGYRLRCTRAVELTAGDDDQEASDPADRPEEGRQTDVDG